MNSMGHGEERRRETIVGRARVIRRLVGNDDAARGAPEASRSTVI